METSLTYQIESDFVQLKRTNETDIVSIVLRMDDNWRVFEYVCDCLLENGLSEKIAADFLTDFMAQSEKIAELSGRELFDILPECWEVA